MRKRELEAEVARLRDELVQEMAARARAERWLQRVRVAHEALHEAIHPRTALK